MERDSRDQKEGGCDGVADIVLAGSGSEGFADAMPGIIFAGSADES
jgi:hypothetical protein